MKHCTCVLPKIENAMKKIHITYFLFVLLFNQACTAQRKSESAIAVEEVSRVIKRLSADDMLGRNALSPKEIAKSADFIANEFKLAKLQYFKENTSYLQAFQLKSTQTATGILSINGLSVPESDYIVSSFAQNLDISKLPTLLKINKGEDFFAKYQEISEHKEDALVLIDPSFKSSFERLRSYLEKGRMTIGDADVANIIYLLSEEEPKSIHLTFQNKVENIPMANVIGVLPGKSKADEYVIFSAHHDHLGIIQAVGQDSIANGADDDASGVTAVIELAKYFSAKNDNERTLIFITFTAEEIGGYGSQYFSKQLNPSTVVAMFNIEMIGKHSKFGKHNAFITGYEKSDFGKILQKNLKGTDFRFYPDPYPEQNLFFRSDNATLAKLGVPAHTISSVEIDKDKLYHSVKDDFASVDAVNITEIIKAIAISASSIISGADTPSRITNVD